MPIPEFVNNFNLVLSNGIIQIYRGSDGKLHIRYILPDPPPDARAAFVAVTAVLNEAAQLKDKGAAEKFQQFAEGVLNTHANAIGGLMAHTGETALAS